MFLKNHQNRIAVVVADAPDRTAIVTRVGASWDLFSLSKDELRQDGWQPWNPTRQPLGDEVPHAIDDGEALRDLIIGPPKLPPTFGAGALEALTSHFTEGPFHLFDAVDGFVHRFNEAKDARLIALRRGGQPILFDSESRLKNLPHEQLEAVAAALEAKKPTAKPNAAYFKELFEMAKKAKAKQVKKVSAVQARAKRADGPVAKAIAIFSKVSNPQDTAAMISAATKAGINESTAKTQLYKYRKEHGIKAERGRPSTVKKTAAKKAVPKAKKPVAKAKAKKPAAKKPAKERAPAPTATPPETVATKAPAKRVLRPKALPVEGAPVPIVLITAEAPKEEITA